MVKPKEKNVGVFKPSLCIIVYAAGFDLYKTEGEEVDYIKKKKWYPATKDFEATAKRISKKLKNAKVYGAKNMDDFIEIINEQEDGSIGTIYVIAHGNPGEIAFSGFLDDQTLWLLGNDFFDLNHSGVENIKKKFTRGAKIIFYACNSGKKNQKGEDFLQAVANKLGVEAQGFSHEIFWHVAYYLDTGAINEESRGQMEVNNKPVHPLNLKPDVIRRSRVKK